jgi:hypothetical protein
MWNAKELAQSLNSEKFQAEAMTESSLSVIIKQHAELPIAIVIQDQFMFAEAILSRVADVHNPDLLNRKLLSVTKYLSLSSFAIEKIDDQPCYVILGESSSSSTLENVELELETLAKNALDVAELIEDHNQENEGK